MTIIFWSPRAALVVDAIYTRIHGGNSKILYWSPRAAVFYYRMVELRKLRKLRSTGPLGGLEVFSIGIELSFRSVELLLRGVELAFRGIELPLRDVELFSRGIELSFRNVELLLKGVELVLRGAFFCQSYPGALGQLLCSPYSVFDEVV